ncbi:heterokaryon incompatibility protein-domain-containing protein [Dichotomopilus funicola]|uniref:Heterokaryon incompatibility protein-domain-containing protein n=1 Tax=Dichotomopilus funicola TaxID=1934379 RepID=A0AAN6UWV1_9PEZI|nr:heterokaryon incompatibility protein-domain-containing protein [Dichotomopilus funicola]
MTPPPYEPYPYSPLNPLTHEIRLLTLSYPPSTNPTNPTNPTDRSDTLTLTLTTTPLTPPSPNTPPPSFSALSYVWGAPSPPTTSPPTLTINTHPVPVTPNLHSAITRLARQKWTGNLWVDALCINQMDTKEKNWQVPMMSRIYTAAEEVVVWLGPEDDKGGLHAVRELGVLFREQVREYKGDGDGAGGGGLGDTRRLVGFVDTVRGFALTGGDVGEGGSGEGKPRVGFDFEAIWRFFRDRAWWKRVWIIQEVVLARKAVMLCGEDPEGRVSSVAWEDVSECIRLPEGAIQSTDPRDRIYGLLGMIRAQDRSRIPVDYSPDMTIGKVLFSVAQVLLHDHGPDILSFCRKTSGGLAAKSQKDLPSWVPDWTAPHSIPLIGGVFFGDDAEARARGSACGSASWQDWPSRSRITTAAYDDPVISLPGIIISKVRSVGQEFTEAPDSPKYLEACRAWLNELGEMAKGVSGEELWRVPMADMGLVKRADAEGTSKFKHGFDVLTGKVMPPTEVTGDVEKQAWMMKESWDYRRVWKLYGRRVFVDDIGRPGLGPVEVKEGDNIAVFAGGHVPFLLSSVPEEGTELRHHLVGPTYIFGLMDGEATVNDPPFGDIQLQ